MTQRSRPVDVPRDPITGPNEPAYAATDSAYGVARHAARQRLLNAYLRESGRNPSETGDGLARVPLSGERAIVVPLRHRSEFGHHVYGDDAWLERPGAAREPLTHREVVALLLDEVATFAANTWGEAGDHGALARQIDGSIAATARYLAESAADDHAGVATDPTRQAEQSVRFGHPFHPTPKSIDGFGDDLPRYAPELGARFRLRWLAVRADVLLERRVAAGAWVPPAVVRRTPSGYESLPMHPWQAEYLVRQPRMAELLADGILIMLGELGGIGYPTSSVRTVCDPAFPTSWKLPLHVRITNFVRTNPVEHLRRAADASDLIARLAPSWRHERFGVLLETGYRGVDPAVVGDDLAADIAVLFREYPFTDGRYTPRVVAGLLEARGDGAPAIVDEVRRSGGSQSEWLRRYLRVVLLPLLDVFERDGVSFEAHVQNSLLHTDGGWPVRFWVRDMEGTSVSADRCSSVADTSPLCYSDAEAWLRLRYHAITNHLGHLIGVLGRHGHGERPLWMTAREVLLDEGGALANELVTSPMLPAKANLISRFANRGERPLYVDVPNPMCR
ncbi:IucA/IucC family protein [Haloechinothrix salitolerans]|uniref:IucA/IucC family protein n=1 Tax=Haloechinothrix salitolerans TaxID=926830 RepID=A0ABW2BV90_9PSEU